MPISRAVFEAVASHRSPDFIGAIDAGLRDLLIAPIKSTLQWEATASKMALKIAKNGLVSSSTCSKIAILKSRFWGCCFSPKHRFYCIFGWIGSFWVDCANKIDASVRSNRLKIAILKWWFLSMCYYSQGVFGHFWGAILSMLLLRKSPILLAKTVYLVELNFLGQ